MVKNIIEKNTHNFIKNNKIYLSFDMWKFIKKTTSIIKQINYIR